MLIMGSIIWNQELSMIKVSVRRRKIIKQEIIRKLQKQVSIIRMTKFKEFVAYLAFLIIIPTFSCFELQWGLYRWIDNDQSLNQPFTLRTINLSHPHHPSLFVSITTDLNIKQSFNCYNASSYQVGEVGQIRLITAGSALAIEIERVSNFGLEVTCHQKQCKTVQAQIQDQFKSGIGSFSHCKLQQNHISCQPSQKGFSLKISVSKNDAEKKVQNFEQLMSNNTHAFMKIFNISTAEAIHLQIVQNALSSAISSICLYKYAADGQYYLGFCQQTRSKKWKYDFKFAPFTLYLMAEYYYQLAKEIYQDYFDLYESKLVYPMSYESQVLPMPEHIQIFSRFGSILQLQDEVQLLNSMFVTPMLKQLGTLHEQLNYREAKKLHPLLLKMLKQKWSSTSSAMSLKSVYEQSFTDDFKYHDYGEQIDQSIAKISWIYKVIDTFTGLLIKHKSFFMPVEQIKQHLQEHFTLMNIMKVYIGEDGGVKTGKYRDIIDVGDNLKLYSKYIGYDAILPYVYGLCKVYPQAVIKQLETPFGLKSSNQGDINQNEKKYRFRGDIHSYFNLKLITGIVYRLQQDKSMPQARRKQLIGSLQKMASSVGKKILKDYQENRDIYTSWSTDGKGKEKCGWRKIVSALFLRWV